MTRFVILALVALGLAVPLVVLAQQDEPPIVLDREEAAPEPGAEAPGEVEEGFSLLEEGTKLILRGLMDEVEPALRDLNAELGTALAEMEPAMRELARLIGDIRNYHPPEILPNGDIILRRRVPLDPAAPGADGPIDL